MRILYKNLSVMLLTSTLVACTSTLQSPNAAAVKPVVNTIASAPLKSADINQVLTLEKIMSDPDWLGRQPEQQYWGDDSQSVYYQRKRAGSIIKDTFRRELNGEGNGQKITLPDAHKVAYKNRVLNRDGTMAAWVFQSNIFVKNLKTGSLSQLTRSSDSVSQLTFLANGHLSYQQSNRILSINVQTGMTRQLMSWKFAKAPGGVERPQDYIAEQQLELIQYVAKKRKQKQLRFDFSQQIKRENPTVTPEPFYFETGFTLVEASISPAGDKAIVVITKDEPQSDDSDIMPNYIVENGRVKAQNVRRRVADEKPVNHQLWLVDLNTGAQSQLNYTHLPGYNEDVLAGVKRENAALIGEEYQSNRLPRDIGLMLDWYWSQSPIQWHNNGQQVAIMLEAWDNKDRWIASVDFSTRQLVSQHRMHDDAWVNYKFNSFGWLNHSETLYYLSEQSGYAHLYTKPLNGTEVALTQGQYEVDNLTLTPDDQYVYFKANQSHPGIYEIYRVNVASGQIEQLTELGGMNDYALSPDQSQLLIKHSELLMPPELYVQAVESQQARRLTHTVSDAFLSMPWTAPNIVAVPSSHTQQPVYSRVYLPKDVQQGKARRAVIFNHGAGYLQNSHLGWSGYFREFMFHSMLAQQGYVVMDMDYRASMGYGRDWRTAIYRQMGTPETQDLQDGVNWLVNEANVDRGRVGTYGGSYGGFMTFMALFTEPELFQAGAALRPVTDWAHYNHPYTSNILNIPDVDPIAYERSSPIYFAQGLNKPLLINAPMVDDNVFFVDVVRLVQRLIELEKQNFETAIFPVEPHGFVQPSSWLDEYRRIYKLFETEL